MDKILTSKIRSPNALDEEDYELLFDCVKNGKSIILSKNSSPMERKVYRLLKNYRYSLMIITEPITKNQIEKLASS